MPGLRDAHGPRDREPRVTPGARGRHVEHEASHGLDDSRPDLDQSLAERRNLRPQKLVRIDYKGEYVGEGRLDLLVGDRLVVELKAVRSFAPIDKAKLISYLKAAGRHLALLINVHVPSLKDGIQRVVLS